MKAAISEFFDQLDRRGHEPMLERVTATIRWDIVDGDRTEHRVIRIDHGDLSTAVGATSADCVITADRAVYEDVLSGRSTGMAVFLRGAAAVDGDPRLVVLAQRLLHPEQPRASGTAASPTPGGRGE